MGKLTTVGVQITATASKFNSAVERMRMAFALLAEQANKGRRELVSMARWASMAFWLASKGGRMTRLGLMEPWLVIVRLPWWRAVPQYLPGDDLEELRDILEPEIKIVVKYEWPPNWWRWSRIKKRMRWRHPLGREYEMPDAD